MPEGSLRRFDQIIDEAQAAQKTGNFAVALEGWQEAERIAPNPFDAGRAMRGKAASLDRLGDSKGAEKEAKEALELHEHVRLHMSYADAAEKDAVDREVGESAGVLGRILSRRVIASELAGLWSPAEARDQSHEGLDLLRYSYAELTMLEDKTGIPDQHTLNVLPRLAVVTTLYDDVPAGREYATEARKRAGRAEAEDNPTSSRISTEYVKQAVRQSVVRGNGALAVSRLVAVPVVGRRAALWVASKIM